MTTTAQHVVSATLDVEDLRVRVDDRLSVFLTEQAERLLAVSPDLAPAVESLAGLTARGKRFRAAFAYWGWRGAGGPPDSGIVDIAAALELFHAAALIHDDVMDASDQRRGMPTVHRRFETYHRSEGLEGPADRFGEASAVLVGDFCLTWSDELFAAAELDQQALVRGRRVYSLMRTQVIAGQYLDILGQGRPDGTVDEARRVLRFKSAKYTVEHPLRLGGELAGASPHLLDTYARFGLPVGEAFQLRDDVLGVFGDPQQTGKPTGDDLREGKHTMLVALATARASAAQRGVLDSHLGDPRLSAVGVQRLRRVIEETGALREVESMIDGLLGEAESALARADIDEPARGVLLALAYAATRRTS